MQWTESHKTHSDLSPQADVAKPQGGNELSEHLLTVG